MRFKPSLEHLLDFLQFQNKVDSTLEGEMIKPDVLRLQTYFKASYQTILKDDQNVQEHEIVKRITEYIGTEQWTLAEHRVLSSMLLYLSKGNLPNVDSLLLEALENRHDKESIHQNFSDFLFHYYLIQGGVLPLGYHSNNLVTDMIDYVFRFDWSETNL